MIICLYYFFIQFIMNLGKNFFFLYFFFIYRKKSFLKTKNFKKKAIKLQIRTKPSGDGKIIKKIFFIYSKIF